MIKDQVLKSFSGKNVLITGGTGLIGRNIVHMLCDAGASVKIASLDRIDVDKRASHAFADLTDFNLCNELVKDMDYVFHVAGIKGSIDVTMSKPASFFVPLLMMNTNILEASRLNKVRKLVYTSSIGAYPSAEIFCESQGSDGPPMDMFPGWAKRMAEMQIESYRIQYGIEHYSVVRPCNVYGPGDNFDPKNAMVIPTLMSRIFNKENPVKVWGDGSAVRDFAFSRDCAEGVILALYHGTKGHKFLNLGSGIGCSVKELLETLHSFLQFNYEFDTTKPSGFPRRVMDISLAREVIDYNPTTSLYDGLKETWEWFLINKDEYLLKQNYFKTDN
ncbi:MAG: NAD-dependent epimerase/dehydratase family protein [Desulfuromonadaceae bacterium]|nr:NAD-dependent epimerase/dehydratase family protein [Desulfuromonadaceae bacterium]MDD5104190.1 NAD-dependent epimerase/dehydratase family protein [Desulfuromonadaceae bacterium]